jgi:soluble lytic murein transglycosylase-like protein
MGPFQFMPGTAKDYGLDEKSVWDLAKSSEAAARYFQDLLKMFKGDVNKAAAGYNWGQGNVQGLISQYGDQWREHLPPETAKYLDNLNRAGISGNSFSAQPGQGIKISIYNATGGQVNTVVSALAA